MAMPELGAPDFFARFIDESWLRKAHEDPVHPGMPVVDPHHHITAFPSIDYDIDKLAKDLRSGHRVLATVHLEGHCHYRQDGPEAYRPVGETEFIARAARDYAEDRIAAGIVGNADLLLGDAVAGVLEAHVAAAQGRFRGIRANLYWDEIVTLGPTLPQGLTDDPRLQSGIARLEPLGLSLDVTAFHPNLPDIGRLADRHPNTRFIVNHMGMPLAVGPYAGRADEVFAVWRRGIEALSLRPNVLMKLGGTFNPYLTLAGMEGSRDLPAPRPSDELADLLRRYVRVCVAAFGANRCMFETNFPVDKAFVSYVTLWNTFKKLAAEYSVDEQKALVANTAIEAYELNVDLR